MAKLGGGSRSSASVGSEAATDTPILGIAVVDTLIYAPQCRAELENPQAPPQSAGLRGHGVLPAARGGVDRRCVIGERPYEQLPDGAIVEERANLRIKGKDAVIDAYALLALP